MGQNQSPLGITELVSRVGDEHILVQGLQQNLDEAKVVKRDGVVTFFTAPDKVVDMLAGEESKWVGMVIWLPRERIPK